MDVTFYTCDRPNSENQASQRLARQVGVSYPSGQLQFFSIMSSFCHCFMLACRVIFFTCGIGLGQVLIKEE